MIILDATPKSLEFKLGGAVSANELPFQASYLDLDAFAPDNQDGISNGAAAVTIVAAPGGSETRQVKQFTIFNDDTAAADVIIQYNNNGTIRQMTEISVPANGTLVYTDGEGFRVINSSGQVLSSSIDTTAFAELAVNETISGAWTFAANTKHNDNVKALFGDAGDAAIYYDSADLNIDPQEVGGGNLLLVPNGGNVGIGEAAPGTLLDMAGAAPYLALHNTTEEDGDGGRESRIIFEGEQSGGELTALAWIEASHHGAADDEKGALLFYTNDGNDGAAPTLAMEIDSAGMVGIGAANPETRLHVVGGTGITAGLTLHDNDTDATQKEARIKGGHYTNAEEPVTLFILQAAQTANTLFVGGGSNVENALSQIIFYTAATPTTTTGSLRMWIAPNGNVGIGTPAAAGTLLELESTLPYLTFHNNTHEDIDGGRESLLIFEGEQSGGELTTLAWIRASHEGAADDQKGELLFYTNDGDDGTSPTLGMTLNSAAMLTLVGDFDHDGTNLGLFGTAPAAQQTITGARDVPEEALADLLTKLALYGLIIDSTTAS